MKKESSFQDLGNDTIIELEENEKGIFMPVKIIESKKPIKRKHKNAAIKYDILAENPLNEIADGFEQGLKFVKKIKTMFDQGDF